MNDKQFTDELFKRMYDMGYKKAEIDKGHIFFYGANTFMSMWIPRVPVDCTCFEPTKQCIDICEYLGAITEWEKVKVDTPILVRKSNGYNWKKRYFAYFKDGMVHAWRDGATSWSTEDDRDTIEWSDAKLAEV